MSITLTIGTQSIQSNYSNLKTSIEEEIKKIIDNQNVQMIEEYYLKQIQQLKVISEKLKFINQEIKDINYLELQTELFEDAHYNVISKGLDEQKLLNEDGEIRKVCSFNKYGS